MFTLLLAIPLCLPMAYAANQELLDRVVAVVNDEVITQAELDTFLRPLYAEYSQQLSGEELQKAIQEARQKLLNQMIEDKLVLQEAVQQGIEVKEEDVEKELAAFKKKMEKPGELELMLEKEGMTLNSLRERMRKQVLIRQVQDREIRSKVVVSPAEAEDFYKQNPTQFVTKERVQARSLTINKNSQSRAKGIPDEYARKKLEKLFGEVKKGGNFEEIIEKNSDDNNAQKKGLGDWIERGSMIEAVEEAIFKTPIGQFTGIVETPIGYHVFRIEAKEPAKQYSFEEAKDQINGYLFQQKSNQRFLVWVEELKKAAYISIR